jgi:hypothetical protein
MTCLWPKRRHGCSNAVAFAVVVTTTSTKQALTRGRSRSARPSLQTAGSVRKFDRVYLLLTVRTKARTHAVSRSILQL